MAQQYIKCRPTCDQRKYRKERNIGSSPILRSADMYVPANFTQSLENGIKKIFEDYMNSWRKNDTIKANQLQDTLNAENFNYVILYLMVMIGMFSFIVVSVLVSTTRSKRHKPLDDQDPYSRYIANDFSESKGMVLENPSARSYSAPMSP
ncbi:potassium voltage-gated channel subfamily E member 2 isoform X2 [Engystomops pustulosus]|uniref:potassium voltage-gated channel subfamily E member 2 isoform X2 n=1 Tax=Engystomops pustulosus TaxID=76066 RepID=UPI003AFA69E9